MSATVICPDCKGRVNLRTNECACDIVTLTPYTGEFPMDFLLPDESVHASGDGSPAAVVETAHGPVRIEVGQHAQRQPDGRIEIINDCYWQFHERSGDGNDVCPNCGLTFKR